MFCSGSRQMLSYSTEQCLTKIKDEMWCEKGGSVVVVVVCSPNGLIYGFQMVAGMFISA